MRDVVLETQEMLKQPLAKVEQEKIFTLLKESPTKFFSKETIDSARKISEHWYCYYKGYLLLNEAMSFFSSKEGLFVFLQAFAKKFAKDNGTKNHIGMVLYEEGGLYVHEFMDIICENNLHSYIFTEKN